MENVALPDDGPGAGQMVLTAESPTAEAYLQWADPRELAMFVRGRDARPRSIGARADGQASGPAQTAAPSPAGCTWNGALTIPFELAAGESHSIRIALTWHFPNRYVNFVQFGPQRDYGHSRFWLGNAYAGRFADAIESADVAQREWDDLRTASRSWTDALSDTTLPADVVERMAAQASLLRSPTCFQAADGRFFGFEGVCGASTPDSGEYGGSCPLNCTHVWNYAQAVSRLFPSLERSMRETEYCVMQAPEGYLPHRVIAPIHHPQLWGVAIAGPREPALDGMLGAVLKTYREVRFGAGEEWLARYWPSTRRLIDYVMRTWDPNATGVVRGEQPSTHDSNLRGVNPFIGTYWLAALRAGEELARLVDENAYAASLNERFAVGSRAYDELLWNGAYYVQRLDSGESSEDQWLDGCLADQLVGQWWAHQLDLGYVLPEDHIRTALRSILTHNFRDPLGEIDHGWRIFADGDDAGLLMCSWPHGGRPDVPTAYSDEVWTGVEYQVAAHCLYEGLTHEGMKILRGVWGRYDGSRRNPYNEIECGDHYARAMAGWTVLEALTGFCWNASELAMRLAPDATNRPWRVPFLNDTAWGTATIEDGASTLELQCRGGELRLRSLELAGVPWTSASVIVGGVRHPCAAEVRTSGTRLMLDPVLTIRAGESVTLTEEQTHDD